MENVIKIDDHKFRINERFDPSIKNRCQHLNTTFDENGQTVKCDDCDSNLNPYWVLKNLVVAYDKAQKKLERDRQTLNEERETLITLRAAKEIQSAWRSKHMAPCCPHCHRGILPEDVLNGISKVSKEYEIARRKEEPRRKW